MTKAEAWDIVSGIVENIDTEDMTQLIERLDDLLKKQENQYKNDDCMKNGVAKKLNKAAAERQVIVTWYKPEKKLPPADCNTIITFSGKTKNVECKHALGTASYFPGEGWMIDGMDENASDRMTIEAWADLDPYEERN